MSKHERFIKTRIETLIQSAVLASSWCSGGIEEFPLCEYVMQSLFLQMTGFNEQKLKCIIWEIATDDYEVRYDVLHNSLIGECSNLKDKNKVLNLFVNCINDDYDVSVIKNGLVLGTGKAFHYLFDESVFRVWLPKEYNNMSKILAENFDDQFFVKNGKNFALFANIENLGKGKDYYLCDGFNHLYCHRNRCAHNLLSYQENLPELKSLRKDEYEKYDNWFFRFWLLMLLDNLFIKLYGDYEIAKRNKY